VAPAARGADGRRDRRARTADHRAKGRRVGAVRMAKEATRSAPAVLLPDPGGGPAAVLTGADVAVAAAPVLDAAVALIRRAYHLTRLTAPRPDVARHDKPTTTCGCHAATENEPELIRTPTHAAGRSRSGSRSA
jgi:hypothetical protein